MREDLSCYICKSPFKDSDFILPLVVVIVLPFGDFRLTVIQHFHCALEHMLGSLKESTIADHDLAKIENKVMEFLTSIQKGTKQ